MRKAAQPKTKPSGKKEKREGKPLAAPRLRPQGKAKKEGGGGEKKS